MFLPRRKLRRNFSKTRKNATRPLDLSSRVGWKIFPKRTAKKAATVTSPALWFREVFTPGLAPRRVSGQKKEMGAKVIGSMKRGVNLQEIPASIPEPVWDCIEAARFLRL